MNEFVRQAFSAGLDGRYRGVDTALNMEKAALTSVMRCAMRNKSSATGMSFCWGGAAAARFRPFINRRPKTRPLRAVRVGPDRI